jgi:hypothetical protein
VVIKKTANRKELKKSKIFTCIIGALSFSIPIILFFTPPTDYDGGPMLGYNLLFFFPLSFLALIFSSIVYFRLKYFRADLSIKLMLIIATLPALILAATILFNFVRISNQPEILDLEIPNETIKINLNDSLEIKLHGFTKRTLENEKIIEVKIINLVPYINGMYSFKDGGKFISNKKNQELLYNIQNDSLIIYAKEYEFSFFNKTRIPLPFKIEKIESLKTEKEQQEKNDLKKINWN